MTTIYLICQIIDMGDHIIAAKYDKNEADSIVQKMNDDYKSKKISDLIAHCAYTQEDAIKYVNSSVEYYVNSIEID